MKTLFKSAFLFFALVLTNSLTFASEKVSEVYVSQSSLSDISIPELLNTSWFWMLIATVFVVAICALIAVKDQEDVHAPEHAI